jgi:bacterioferritin-associated ferredoxin
MIVCVCHRLSDRQIREACADGEAPTVSSVYRCMGCRPQCGKCVPDVREMLRAARVAAEEASSSAGALAEGPPDHVV